MAATRDATYYFDNRSLVLQVEDVLFKVDMSRLASHSDVFRNMLGLPSGSGDAEGTSDANPVKLPQIKAEEFRSLLYIFYQSPVDPGFLSFMSGASNQENHCPTAFKKYLDIARLSHRFCMTEVEAWAQKQLQQMEPHIASTNWLKLDHLLATLSYAKLRANRPDDELVRTTSIMLYYIVSQSSEGCLLELYRGRSPDVDPVLEGLVILCILKSGPKSSLWAKLTRAEKAPLYAIQAHLTPLPNLPPFNSLFSLGAIDRALQEELSGGLCVNVYNQLRSSWNAEISFDSWHSDAPLRGITETVNLPLARRRIQESLPSSSCECAGVDCRTILLTKVDTLMAALFCEVTNLRDKFTN